MVNRILLIDVEKELSDDDKRTGRAKFTHYPIGLLYLASAVRADFPDINIKIFHTFAPNFSIEHIKMLVEDFSPELIGLRSLSRAQDHFKKIALMLKEWRPNIPVIAGGPHPSISFRELLLAKIVDLVVIGEGERTFTNLIRRLREGASLPLTIPGTAVLENSVVRLNLLNPPIEDIDNIPFPNYDLINLNDYVGYRNQAFQDLSKTALIVASRGCPYKCFYCHKLFGVGVRHRSATNIVAEMREHVEKRNIRDFVFIDDIFNVPIAIAKETLRLIKKTLPPVRINFPNGLRADQIDKELIDLLEKAGTVNVALAVETASPRLQKMIGKNLNLDKAYATIQAMSRRFITCVFFMVGFPTETYDEAMDTIAFGEKLHYVAEPTLSVVTVFRNSPLFHMLQPNEQQIERIINQEKIFNTPKLFEDFSYYGDFFSDEKVPLKKEQIQDLRQEWILRVVTNPVRTANSHFIMKKYLSKEQLFKNYARFFGKEKFDDHNYRMLEKRRRPRIIKGFGVCSLPGGKDLDRECEIKNISEAGICLIAHERIVRQRTISLEIFLSDAREPLRVKGRIIWKQILTSNPSEGTFFSLGIEFVELNNNDRLILRSALLKCA